MTVFGSRSYIYHPTFSAVLCKIKRREKNSMVFFVSTGERGHEGEEVVRRISSLERKKRKTSQSQQLLWWSKDDEVGGTGHDLVQLAF